MISLNLLHHLVMMTRCLDTSQFCRMPEPATGGGRAVVEVK